MGNTSRTPCCWVIILLTIPAIWVTHLVIGLQAPPSAFEQCLHYQILHITGFVSTLGNYSLTHSVHRTALRIIRSVGSLPGRVWFSLHSRSLSEWWIWLSLAALWRFAMLQDEYIHISDVTVYGCAATHTGTRRCVWLASTPRHMPVVARDLA
jgi:hypothetical protein